MCPTYCVESQFLHVEWSWRVILYQWRGYRYAKYWKYWWPVGVLICLRCLSRIECPELFVCDTQCGSKYPPLSAGREWQAGTLKTVVFSVVGSDYIWKLLLWRRAVEVLELIGGYYVDYIGMIRNSCLAPSACWLFCQGRRLPTMGPAPSSLKCTGDLHLVCLRKVSPSWKMRFEIILTFNAVKIGWVGLHACLLLNSEIDSLGPRNMAFCYQRPHECAGRGASA